MKNIYNIFYNKYNYNLIIIFFKKIIFNNK